jgi:hypothetical protein
MIFKNYIGKTALNKRVLKEMGIEKNYSCGGPLRFLVIREKI